MSDQPCKGCILKQFKEIGLIPQDADRLEILSHKGGVDRCRYYVRGKAYPLTAPSVTVSEVAQCDKPCETNEAAELAAAWVPSRDTDNQIKGDAK